MKKGVQGKFIFLLGFMGCGKSTVGKELSDRLPEWTFIDLDAYIEKAEGNSISSIFSENGESHFRKLETKYLRQILNNTGKSYIVSLGGGTPCYNSNMDLILGHHSFYLSLGVDRLVDRLYINASHRPLIQGLSKTELKRFIKQKLVKRKPYYKQAKNTIMAHTQPTQLASRIIRLMI